MKVSRIYIPPNGFAGQGQQTHANQLVPAAAGMTRAPRKRRKKSSTRSSTRKRSTRKRSTRKSKRPARLVKGSAAAKRYMAKIRRKRKR